MVNYDRIEQQLKLLRRIYTDRYKKPGRQWGSISVAPLTAREVRAKEDLISYISHLSRMLALHRRGVYDAVYARVPPGVDRLIRGYLG